MPMLIRPYVVHFDRVTSTNDVATKLLQFCKPPEGMVVSTDHQYKGKGQRDATWDSNPGQNITVSIITYPVQLATSAIYTLNKAVCVGVAHCVEHFVTPHPVQIKWPNDVYVNGLKISGILIQNTIMGKSIQHSIIGVGLNVNQTQFEGTFAATSLQLIRDKKFSVPEVRIQLLSALENVFQAVQTGDYGWVDREYHSRLLGLNKMQKLRYPHNGVTFEGKIKAVDQLGKLHVEHDDQLILYQVKEIEFLI